MKTLILFVLCPPLLAASCGGNSGDQDTLPFAPAGPDAAPDPMQPGPFPVGVRTVELVDPSRTDDQGAPRRLLTEIWYPAVQQTSGEGWTYEPEAEASEEFMGDDYQKLVDADLPGMHSFAVRDAEPDREHGPYPLILFSHGAYGIRWQSVFYTPHLASHGYVVVGCDHTGHTVWDLLRDGFDDGKTAVSSQQRLDDSRFLIDTLSAASRDPEDFLGGLLDPRRVGVTGHSFGGWSSVTVGCTDERVDVVVSHSPVIGLAVVFGCVLESYPVPLLVMGGTRDMTVPWKDQYCEYNLVTSDTQYLYELVDGGHYTFSNICELDLLTLSQEFDFGTAEEALEDGCSPTENVAAADAHQTINHYATALFNQVLRGSAGSAALLEDRDDGLFAPVNFHQGHAPDWPDGGCDD